MKRVSIALVAACLLTSHLIAQRAGVLVGGQNVYGSRSIVARTMFSGRTVGVRQNLDGSVCYPAPSYQYCNYDSNYYARDWYGVWAYPSWNGIYESDPPQLSYTYQLPEPPPPPPPLPTPVLREYHWPEEVNPTPAFSIVTNSGAVSLATMVWVEGDDVHFNAEDGGVRQIPLPSVSRPLTESANAQKHLSLRLPS